MSINLYQASRQWATRPADERFWSLQDLKASLWKERQNTTVRPAEGEGAVQLRNLSVVPEGEEMMLRGPGGNLVQMTHWSFGQLCQRAGCPAGFMRNLPLEYAARDLNYMLQNVDADANKEVSALLYRPNGHTVCRAITSTDYGRLWDGTVVNHILPALDMGWRVPPARPAGNDSRARPATEADILPNQGNFGLSVKVGDMIAPAGVYRGLMDMFLFLVNPERIIDDGGQGLMRGVFVWNSEVGNSSFGVLQFLLENVCGNHIVWGASDIKELKLIHRKHINERFGEELAVRLRKYADNGMVEEEKMIKLAKGHILGLNRQEVIDNLYAIKKLGLSQKDIGGAYDMAVQWEHTALANPNTAWGLVHGLTRYSQLSQYTDERTKLDKAGGFILSLAQAT